MAKYRICFRVEQTLAGSIEVEAESPEAAAKAFEEGGYEDQRLDAKLDLDDSQDSIVEIVEIRNRYATMLRPPGYGGLPTDVSWTYVEAPIQNFGITFRVPGSVEELPRSRYLYGVIETDRPLTPAELRHFDIKPV